MEKPLHFQSRGSVVFAGRDAEAQAQALVTLMLQQTLPVNSEEADQHPDATRSWLGNWYWGVRALAARALYLAKAEEPLLEGVEIGPSTTAHSTERSESEPVATGHKNRDASGQAGICLRGLRESVQGRELSEVRRGITVFFANFIGLLVSLIGMDLVLALVREAWPDVSFDDIVSSSGEVKE